MRGAGIRSHLLKAMIDDLVAKKNENKYDIQNSRGSTVQNQNNSSVNKAREDDNGIDMDEGEANNDTEDDDREEGEEEDDEDTDKEKGEQEDEGDENEEKEEDDEEEEDEVVEGEEKRRMVQFSLTTTFSTSQHHVIEMSPYHSWKFMLTSPKPRQVTTITMKSVSQFKLKT